MPAPATWLTFLDLFNGCFTAPSRLLFGQLITAWGLCPGRRTLTRLWSVIPASGRQPYAAYTRWVREGMWEMDELWRLLARHLINHWAPSGRVQVLLDDTLNKKTGPKMAGAGMFRDPVLSTASYTVIAWGLNIVVLALCIPAPWGGEPLALPVLVRVHRKGELTTVQLAATMINQLAAWLPDRNFRLVVDGAYASLVGYDLPRAVVVTRLRRNAALHDLRPPPTGRRGRPRTKGDRLPTPVQLAATATDWTPAEVSIRGQKVERLFWVRQLLWYEAAGSRPLQLVIVRDPQSHERDDFFLTTDISALPAEVASAYADRWSIEDTNRNGKQYLGAEDPQSWVGLGPERVASLACWLYAAIWHWFASSHADHQTWPDRPWYTTKRTPSFADALATLRREIWGSVISAPSALGPLPPEIAGLITTVLAEAA